MAGTRVRQTDLVYSFRERLLRSGVAALDPLAYFLVGRWESPTEVPDPPGRPTCFVRFGTPGTPEGSGRKPTHLKPEPYPMEQVMETRTETPNELNPERTEPPN